MEHEVCLSAAELYFLGRVMQAKYIDYSYIAMMEDIEKRYKLIESSTMSALSRKGIVSEDFSGNVTVDKENEMLFKPVFEGLISSSAELVMPPEAGESSFCRMHILGDNITMATISGKSICFSRFGEEQMDAFLRRLTGALTEEEPPEEGDDLKMPDRVIVLKSTVYSGESLLVQIYICHGRIYLIQGNDKTEQLTVEDYLEIGKLLLGGKVYVTQK